MITARCRGYQNCAGIHEAIKNKQTNPHYEDMLSSDLKSLVYKLPELQTGSEEEDREGHVSYLYLSLHSDSF